MEGYGHGKGREDGFDKGGQAEASGYGQTTITAANDRDQSPGC
jgi:hypothetical protein